MRNTLYPKARTNDLVVMPLADETLVYDLSTNEAHCLNETAAFVWSICDGDTSVDTMLGMVRERFGESVNQDFVVFAIDKLTGRDLLSGLQSPAGPLTSRREAMRKIGLATVVALPVIASVVAPPNVLGSISCVCSSPAECRIPQCLNAINCNPFGICAPN